MKHAREDYERFQDPEGKIPEDEPVFLLRGQDKYAAMAVAYYAGLVKHANPRLAERCREWSIEMADWEPEKVPDAPEDAI